MSSNPIITNFISNINGTYQDLGNLYYYWSSNTVNIPSNGVTVKKYSIKYNKPTIILETDITVSIDKSPNNGDQTITFGPEVQDCIVITGNTTNGNGVAFSPNGINLYGLGTTQVISNAASSIFWDGIKWFGTVYTTNYLSYNGINWGTMGTATPFVGGTPYGYRAYYNGIIYLMAGNGTTTNMGYSYDGINWTGILGYVCTTVNTLAWNGTVWLAGSTGGGNTLAYSYNGINWTGLGNTAPLPATNVNAIKWLGDKWIIGGNTVSNSAIAYTRDPNGITGWTTTNTATLMTSVSAFGWNGQIAVASGYGPNTLAYSVDGITWIPNGKTVFTGFGTISNIVWNGRLFLTGGAAGGNSFAYSTTGNVFVGLGNTLMAQPYDIAFNSVRKNTINFQRNMTIAVGQGASTTIGYSYDGITWTSYNNTLIGGQSGIVYNGKLWITGTNTTGNSIAFSRDAYTWYPVPVTGKIISNVTNIVWNGSIFVAVSSSTTTGNCIAYSYDGLTWLPASNSIALFPGGSPTEAAGSSIGIIVGGTSTNNGNTLAYSSNGYTWAGLGNVNSSTACYSVATNGQMWLAGLNNGIAYSNDGLTWQPCASNPFTGYANSIAWNGIKWVAVGNSTTGNAAYSYDGINWTIGVSSFPSSGSSVIWNGTVWIAAINSATTNFAYSYDGISWTNNASTLFSTSATAVATNYQVTPKPYIQHLNLGFGQCLSGNTVLYTMAYSPDGTTWTGLGNSVFTTNNCGYWNGTIWVAGGTASFAGVGNTIGYSYDGQTWVGSGTTSFDTACYGVAYNGNVWVAVGQGITTIAYSTNGITWTPVTYSGQFFTSAFNVGWNGNVFLACGKGSYAIASSYDGVSWTAAQSSLSYALAGINYVFTNGGIWLAALNSSAGLAYTYDMTGLTGWTNVASSPFSISGTGIAYNGIYFVASGTGANGIAYSNDGVNWLSASTINCNSVCWNGKRFVATGNGNIIYSNDGVVWYTAQYQTKNYPFNGNGVASNSGIGAYVAPSAMVLNQYFLNGNGLTSSNSMDIVSSDPYFQTGFTNISINVKTNNIYK